MTARDKYARAARRQTNARDGTFLRVYIAGPVSGIPEGNRPAFEAARARIEALPCFKATIPHDVYTPSGDALRCPGVCWCEAMLACLPVLEAAHYVHMLPGWTRSPGARREYERARELGKTIVFEPGATTHPEARL